MMCHSASLSHPQRVQVSHADSGCVVPGMTDTHNFFKQRWWIPWIISLFQTTTIATVPSLSYQPVHIAIQDCCTSIAGHRCQPMSRRPSRIWLAYQVCWAISWKFLLGHCFVMHDEWRTLEKDVMQVWCSYHCATRRTSSLKPAPNCSHHLRCGRDTRLVAKLDTVFFSMPDQRCVALQRYSLLFLAIFWKAL